MAEMMGLTLRFTAAMFAILTLANCATRVDVPPVRQAVEPAVIISPAPLRPQNESAVLDAAPAPPQQVQVLPERVARAPVTSEIQPAPPAPIIQGPAPVAELPVAVAQLPVPVAQFPAPVAQFPAPVAQLPAPVAQSPALPDPQFLPFEILSFANLSGWADGDHVPALIAFRASCEKLLDGAADASVGGWRHFDVPVFGSLLDWRPICDQAWITPEQPDAARAFLERSFLPVSIEGAGDGAALFTAYFEPELQGSRIRGGPYQTPIYAKPPDLEFRDEYFTRAEIAAGALAGQGLELFWIDDAVDAFFLEIQGSGRVRLPDGSVTRVGYAGKNGHSYKAIGRTLIEWEQLELEGVSVASIRQWIAENPQYQQALFNTNPSTVFFTERTELAKDPSLGPIGSLGIPIFAQRSVAVDRDVYPLGAPVWLDFDSPVGPIERLAVAMDTGGAIKGPLRVDYFFGSGRAAGAAAGATRVEGRFIAFAPRSALARVPQAGT